MILQHFVAKQLKIGETMGVVHSFMWNFVKYAKMEGFRRDSHILSANYTIKELPLHSKWNESLSK